MAITCVVVIRLTNGNLVVNAFHFRVVRSRDSRQIVILLRPLGFDPSNTSKRLNQVPQLWTEIRVSARRHRSKKDHEEKLNCY
jgi:hypothetical protein